MKKLLDFELNVFIIVFVTWTATIVLTAPDCPDQ